MLVLLLLILSLLAAVCAFLAGFAVWQAALVALGAFAALNLLYVIFWVIVASTVDDSKPLAKQSRLCRIGCASISGWLCSYAGVRIHFTGAELLPKEGRFVFVCNHRSMFDPLVAVYTLRDYNLAFISKPSNLKIPYVGKLAYGAGFLPIDW